MLPGTPCTMCLASSFSLLQYMFYKEMCLVSKQYDPMDPAKPLYKCDFSNGDSALDAGAKLE